MFENENSSYMSVVEDIFGAYSPHVQLRVENVMQTITTTDIDGLTTVMEVPTEVVVTEYVPDFTWFAGVALFAIVLHSLMRMIGGLLKCQI